MLALINITEIPEVIKYQGETLCEIIKSHIENVSDSYAGTIRSVSDDVIFGATNPVKFLAMAQDWNECIRRDAINTVHTWLKNGAALDSQFSYSAKVRLSEADDMFHPFGFHCVISENEFGFDYLHTVINGSQLQDMCQNPQNYAIANVTFE